MRWPEGINPVSRDGLMVFSDLDGTLLDHETYDWQPAAAALQALKKGGHQLILASSKTAAEIAPLRAQTGFAHCPAIVENGAGILPPAIAGQTGAQSEDDTDRTRILKTLSGLPPGLRQHFSGFADWTTEQIAEKTGLSREQAALAADRQFSEPGVWSGTEQQLNTFLQKLNAYGITAKRGGRFLTLSCGGDKAHRMAEIVTTARQNGTNPLVIALGDAPNDRAMLEAADIGFIIANPHGTPVAELAGEKTGKILRSGLPGPQGWNESVLSLLEAYSKQASKKQSPGDQTGKGG